MNDTINKLIDLAYVEVPHERDEGTTREFSKRKFAELLIKRCAEIPYWCIETSEDQLVETIMAQRASDAIKDHFGVV